jgi:hypothetical protein
MGGYNRRRAIPRRLVKLTQEGAQTRKERLSLPLCHSAKDTGHQLLCLGMHCLQCLTSSFCEIQQNAPTVFRVPPSFH